MSDVIKKIANNRHISIYPADTQDAPWVVMNSYMESGPEILQDCRALQTPPFSLISIANLRWDEDLSPWPHDPVVSQEDHFTGEASSYCEFLLDQVLTFASRELGSPTLQLLAGYSMAGLFALYAPYLTPAFSRLVCGSPSVWYPGFVDYAKKHTFLKAPQSIYLSIGDKETHTKNPYLCKTQTALEELQEYYSSCGIRTTFELNHGGHYTHASKRMAKGIHWALTDHPSKS